MSDKLSKREAFIKRQEIFVAGLVAVVELVPNAEFLPVSGYMFGWQMEEGHTGHPMKERGGLEFGLSFIRHMIGQGLSVAYAITLSKGGGVFLQSWDEDEDEKLAWPDDPEIVLDAQWHPLRI